MPGPAAGGLLGRVVGGDHDAGDAGLDDRVRARRRAAGVAARLERDVHRRAAQVGAGGGGDRRALGVRAAELGVEALAHDRPSWTITAPTSGFGLVAPAPALGELDRPGEVLVVGGLKGAHGTVATILTRESMSPRSSVRRR